MITMLLANWRQSIVIVLLCTNSITFGLWRMYANKLDQISYVAAVESKQNKEIIDKQKQITEDTTNGWKAAVDSVRANNAKRVLSKPTEAGGVSGSSFNVNGSSTDSIPSPARVAEDCSYSTLTANQLQDWIVKQLSITNKE